MAFPATSDGHPASGLLRDGATNVAFKNVRVDWNGTNVHSVNGTAVSALALLSTATTGATTGTQAAATSDFNVTNGKVNAIIARLQQFGFDIST